MVKNKIKILAMGLLSLVLFIGIFFVPHKTYAAAGSISVTASAGEIIAGNTITVTVKLSNPAGIAYSKFELGIRERALAFAPSVSALEAKSFLILSNSKILIDLSKLSIFPQL